MRTTWCSRYSQDVNYSVKYFCNQLFLSVPFNLVIRNLNKYLLSSRHYVHPCGRYNYK